MKGSSSGVTKEVYIMFAMTEGQLGSTIGYSALSIKEHKYICVDDATYIASSSGDMAKYLEDSLVPAKEYMIDRESMADIIHDYGDTNGAYAMELSVLKRFKEIADEVHMNYLSKPYESFADEEPEVFVVEIND